MKHFQGTTGWGHNHKSINSGYIMYVWGCTLLFSSLYTAIALLCWILCSRSLARSRRSASRRVSASFILLASCSFIAAHFSSICLFSCSRNSFLRRLKRAAFLCQKQLLLFFNIKRSMVSSTILPVLFSLTAGSIEGFSPYLMISDTATFSHCL